MPQVNPDILRWARETAGFNLEDAARKISLNASRAGTGQARLASLEAGESFPSSALLQRMAKQYRRPLLTFYLPNIPQQESFGHDFRTLPEQSDPTNTILSALLRDINVRQSLVRELIEDDDDTQEVSIVGACKSIDGIVAISDAIVENIAFDRAFYRSCRSNEEAFGYLREQAESAGIFVVLAGNLGSWQTAIDVGVFRGFAIADRIAPFVVINDQDAKSAWSFTLLHELAHLCIGVGGISAGTRDSAGIEQLCNDVAAAVLVDRAEIEAMPLDVPTDAINSAANQWRVSRAMVAYQLYRAGRITFSVWQDLTANFLLEWRELRANQRAAAREQEGGPSYYMIKRHRVGGALLNLTRAALTDGSLTPVRAAKILGVKPMSVYNLLGAPSRSSRAA